MKFFIAVYTAECKQYCDEQFFTNLGKLTEQDRELYIVDNSLTREYFDSRLAPNIGKWYRTGLIDQNRYETYNVIHLEIPRTEPNAIFNRNVAVSANYLRDRFLETDAPYFVIFESDIIMPHNTLEMFMDVVDQADIIDGLYHHAYTPHVEMFKSSERGIVPTHHALSGCTIYKRAVIEKISFRYNLDNLGAFPDYYMCVDAATHGFKIASHTGIRCDHLGHSDGVRGQSLIR